MKLSEQYHPSNIQTNLKVAVMEADEESENIAEKFLESKLFFSLRVLGRQSRFFYCNFDNYFASFF